MSAPQKLKKPGCVPSSFLILDTFTLLHKINSNGRLAYLVWVRAHCELGGNEKADIGAKLATSLQETLQSF